MFTFIFKHKGYYANGLRVPRPVKTQQEVSALRKLLTPSSYDVAEWNWSRFYVLHIRTVDIPPKSLSLKSTANNHAYPSCQHNYVL
jgi:hypothetical protein